MLNPVSDLAGVLVVPLLRICDAHVVNLGLFRGKVPLNGNGLYAGKSYRKPAGRYDIGMKVWPVALPAQRTRDADGKVLTVEVVIVPVA